MNPKKGWRKDRELDDSDPEGFVAFMKRYHQWMRVNHYAELTITTSQHALWRFFAWCQERDISQPVEVTRAILERFQRWLFHYRKPEDQQHLKVSTQRNLLTHVRLYFQWMTRQRFLLFNPAADMTLPRIGQQLPRNILTADEVEQILAQTDVNTTLGLRDRTMLEMLYATGMRRMELVQLDLGDISLDEATVLIREGKGRKDRLIPIGQRAMAWLEKYLIEVRPSLILDPDETALFLSGERRRFNPGSVGHLLKKYFIAAGIEKRGVCHIFRHSMATLMLEGGADVRYVQHMLGHENLESTRIYTKVSIKQLKEVHQRTHPASRHRK